MNYDLFQYDLGIINYGMYASSYSEIHGPFSKEFTCYNIISGKLKCFENLEERKKYDYYTIARIFSSILASSIWINKQTD